MNSFFFKLKNINFKNDVNKNSFKNNIINVNNKPIKNDHFSLIGICVSYNYFDTLQFMLPVNYLHFEKIYLITQINDLQTIEFCKKFENVIVLFHNFKNNNKRFDKYGALNYAQEIIYKQHPDSWYLIIDSDIILPNNLIDILDESDNNVENENNNFLNTDIDTIIKMFFDGTNGISFRIKLLKHLYL
jgi:hypothetical protein